MQTEKMSGEALSAEGNYQMFALGIQGISKTDRRR